MISASLAENTSGPEPDTANQAASPANLLSESSYASKDLSPDVVLLIDDDPDVLMALRKELRKLNLTVLTSLDAREGVSLAKHHKPGVVICDIRMPELSGVEVFEAIHQISPDSARVMLTGFSELDTVVSSINRGHVNRYLCKPLDAEMLQLTLSEPGGAGPCQAGANQGCTRVE